MVLPDQHQIFIKRAATLLQLNDINDGISVFKEIQKRENPELIIMFENICTEIAYIISNLQVTLDLEKILIDGVISNQQIVKEEIIMKYNKIRKKSGYLVQIFPPLSIEICHFKNNSNLIGAPYQFFMSFS